MDPQFTTSIHPITCLALLFMLIFIYYTLHYRKQHSATTGYQIRQERQSYPEGYPFFASPFQAKPEIRNQGAYINNLPSKNFVTNSFKGDNSHKENDVRKNLPMKNNFEKETPSWNKLLVQAQETHFPKTINVPWEQRAFVIDRRNDYVENRKDRDSFNPKDRKKEEEFFLYNIAKESSEKENSNYLMPNLNQKAYKSSNGHIEGQTLYQENNRAQKTMPSVIERFDLGFPKFKQEDKSQQDILNIESISRITSDQNTTVNAPHFLEGFGTCVSLEFPSRSDSLSNQNKLNNGVKPYPHEYPVYHANFGTFGKETRNRDQGSIKQNRDYENRDALHSFKKRKWDNRNDELENNKVTSQKSSKALKIDFGKLEESVSSIQFTENQRIEEENTEPIMFNQALKKVKQNDANYDHTRVRISFGDDIPSRGNIARTQPVSHSVSKTETIHKIISGLGTGVNIKHKDVRVDNIQEEFKLDDRFVSNRKKKRNPSPEADKKASKSRVRGEETQKSAIKLKNTQKPFNYQKKSQNHSIEQNVSLKETATIKKEGTTSKIEAEWKVILEKIDADLENDSILENPISEIKEAVVSQKLFSNKKEVPVNVKQSKPKENQFGNANIQHEKQNRDFNYDEDDLSIIDKLDLIKKYKFDDIVFTPSKDLTNLNGEAEDIPLTELVEQACRKDSL